MFTLKIPIDSRTKKRQTCIIKQPKDFFFLRKKKKGKRLSFTSVKEWKGMAFVEEVSESFEFETMEPPPLPVGGLLG